MDSLTQIVLGAACGEIALGKKIGNKALLFGAIGGTIPDLDVLIGNLIYTNEIDQLAFHRGIMHSIMFSLLASPIFGWITFKLYNTGKRIKTTSLKDWIWLYFLAIFTHPLLDSLTQYGTLLFAPFSDKRVALNTISVADPFYTLPFLLCIIVLMFYTRGSAKRRLWLRLSLGLSSAYLIFTFANKLYIDSVFESSLIEQKISVDRFRAQPTILNNFLWYGVAENKTHYYLGMYSIFDEEAEIKNWTKVRKNHDLAPMNNPDLETLKWFSDNYFNLKIDEKDQLIFMDLRYHSLDLSTLEESIFSFILLKKQGRYDIKRYSNRKPTSEQLNAFYNRIKGI